MQLLNMLFLKILEMGLTTGIVIIVVLTVRLLLRGLPKKCSYMLWIVVAFRLVVPFAAASDISIFNLLVQRDISSKTRAGDGAGTGQNMDSLRDTDEDFAVVIGGLTGQKEYVQKDRKSALDTKATAESDHISRPGRIDDDLINFMSFVWITGIMMLAFHTAVLHMRVKRKIRYSVRLYDNVYECDQIRSPFVSGITHPRIYLPFRLGEAERQCVLAHERYHLKRKDYLVKPFAYILVMLYWFQPLVWIAYRLMCIDMEMSCDEKIISEFTIDMRKEYSRLLLAFATNKRQRPVSPLAFGEENAMKRIRNILNYKKTAQWKLSVGVAAIIFTMAACATDASTDRTTTTVSDSTVPVQINLSGVSDQLKSGIQNSTGNTVTNNGANSDIATHHSERYHTDETGQYHVIDHHQAQWAENSMCDTEFCSLDYADADKIVFHISSGLFQYDLQEQRITRSIDLKALNCQEVQTGGKCRITVYQNSDSQLRAVIAPYPYSEEGNYVYDLENDELFAYADELLEGCILFDGLVSKYDLPEEDRLTGWKHAEHILPLGGHSYGILRWDSLNLVTMYYEAGDQRWELFREEQATLPRQIRQDDSFYQAISIYSGRDIDQCLLDYMGLYNMHDYAGVCALSTGLDYSDEMQREFGERSDLLSGAEEISHSEDEKEYLFQFLCGDDYSTGEKVYVSFKYVDGEGWRAEGLPDILGMDNKL